MTEIRLRVYSKLLSFWREESSGRSISELPNEIFDEVSGLARKILSLMRLHEDKSVVYKIASTMLENIKFMISEMLTLRMFKVITSLLEKRNSIGDLKKSFAHVERHLEHIAKGVEMFHSLLDNILKFESSTTEVMHAPIRKIREGYALIRILRKLPKIVGVDMTIYGPFNEEDIVILPQQNAEVLVKRGIAEFIFS
ncbi:MAG: DNA replication complex subunit Gins51 [Candidatus Baldrarchaeia archaeon]